MSASKSELAAVHRLAARLFVKDYSADHGDHFERALYAVEAAELFLDVIAERVKHAAKRRKRAEANRAARAERAKPSGRAFNLPSHGAQTVRA